MSPRTAVKNTVELNVWNYKQVLLLPSLESKTRIKAMGTAEDKMGPNVGKKAGRVPDLGVLSLLFECT